MTWKKVVFENFKLYAVTDLKDADQTILQKVDAAYRGGADIVQLRAKNLNDRKLTSLGLEIRKIADRHRKLFFVNDRADIAVAVSADGIHLGQDDLPIDAARRICRQAGIAMWIGKSTHSIEQSVAAEKEGADYIGVGPVFETPTKPGREPVGVELVRQVSQTARIPFVVIGGINASNLRQVLDAGAKRVAVVRAIFAAKDVRMATAELRQVLDTHMNSSQFAASGS